MYKNCQVFSFILLRNWVSILVLMDLCIKTTLANNLLFRRLSFNPCFNGSMYKNSLAPLGYISIWMSFNPCFNGSMYKNRKGWFVWIQEKWVSILVLMDLCIKTESILSRRLSSLSFNPCFNGSMYKNCRLIPRWVWKTMFQSLF